MKNDPKHSNTRGTSKATKTQSGTSCSNTPTSKKAERYSSNSTAQVGIISKKGSLLAGNTDTTEKTSQRKAKSKKPSEKNSPKGKSTKNSAGNATKRNADATSKGKSVKKGSKKPCDHSYELSVPYDKEGKVSVKRYYAKQPKKHVLHWRCKNCNDRTITWNTDHKIPVFKLNQKYE